VPLDFNEIRQLLLTIAQTDITEVTLKSDDFELTVRKAVSTPQMLSASQAALGTLSEPNTPVTPPISLVVSSPSVMEISPNRGVQSSPTVASVIEQKFVEILSPIVGTFYRASSPGDPPFVEVSDRVKSGQTVCIIEAMKVMNEIDSEVSGQVIEILVQNGEPVEYGQPLMRINPD
jgi:acetyl-CoA carboxylase biotin carboxyl carrier protein